jgi:tRNA modification GTPase
LKEVRTHLNDAQLLVVGNKIDKEDVNAAQREYSAFNTLFISAKEKYGLDDLKQKLVSMFDSRTVNITETIVTNVRHADALRRTNQAVERIISGLTIKIPGDLLAQDIREALFYLGEITGTVSNDELLGNIFGRFCIGK